MRPYLSVSLLSIFLVSCGSTSTAVKNSNNEVKQPIGLLSLVQPVQTAPPPKFNEALHIENTTPEFDPVMNPNVEDLPKAGASFPSPEQRGILREKDRALYAKRGQLKNGQSARPKYSVLDVCNPNKPTESEWEYGTKIKHDIPYYNGNHQLYWGSGYRFDQSVSSNTFLYLPTGKQPHYGGLETGMEFVNTGSGTTKNWAFVRHNGTAGQSKTWYPVDYNWESKYVRYHADGSYRFYTCLVWNDSNQASDAWLWNYSANNGQGAWEWKGGTTAKSGYAEGWVISELIHYNTTCPTVSRGTSTYDIQFYNGTGWSVINEATEGWKHDMACGNTPCNPYYNKGFVSGKEWYHWFVF